MPRGGSGRGQGRKPSWKAGKTKAIKLPELLIPEIVEFARMLDCIAPDKDRPDEIAPIVTEEAVDLLFDELVELKILDRAAQKLTTLRNEIIRRDRVVGIEISPYNKSTFPAERTAEGCDETSNIASSTIKLEATEEKRLTSDQAAALEKLKQFIQTPRQKYFRLTGYA